MTPSKETDDLVKNHVFCGLWIADNTAYKE